MATAVVTSDRRGDASGPVPVLTTAELGSWVAGLAGLDTGVGDGERVDQLRLLEELKCAAAAAQARVTVAFADSQRAAQAAGGTPARRVGEGIAAQVGLARRDSPHRGGRHLGLAHALVTELPHTMTALSAGAISEWRATLIARETGCLSAADRTAVDAALASRPGGLEALGDRETEAAARALAYRLDPHAAVARTAKAHTERRVSLRPAPDTMSILTGLLPVAQGVAAHTALTRTADRLRAEGDPRTRGQIMADTLVQRLTGQATAEAVPVEVQLVITDQTLLGGPGPEGSVGPEGSEGLGRDEPAHLGGFGPIPAGLARQLLLPQPNQAQPDQAEPSGGVAERGRVWLRRLFTRPADGALVGLDSHRRLFPAGLRRMLILRDRYCRTPWCDAPIRHLDHVVAHAEGGSTSLDNGQGLCQGCNHAKQAAGWTARPSPDGTVATTTPTGHTYRSHAQPLPGAPARAAPPSPVGHRIDPFTPAERRFHLLITAA
ncbi:MAG: DUF222 domain-containing protein [Nocardioidaceae bacterium]